MKKYRIPGSLILLLAMALGYIACQKKYTLDLPVTAGVIPVTTSLTGRVVDESHAAVAGATVTIGTVTGTTDINGYFRFNNIIISSPDISYVKVEKNGYFGGSRTYRSYAGSSDFVSIQLIKKSTAGTFSGAAGGSVDVPANGGKIAFAANSIINTGTNASYTGTVSVSAFFINPAASDFQEMMPGALRGVTTDNKQVGLQSFGMMAVELLGAASEKLQLGAGRTATITFPIQAGLLSQAPATIPLWSFNQTTGLWIQEGTATKQATNYVGTVSHFSFWNCDFPLPIINFNALYINQDGLPLSHVKVLIKTVDDPITTSGYGYTDADGFITGTLPAAKPLLATIYNSCGDPIDIRYFGPFVTDVKVGTLTVKNTVAPRVKFSGTVVNCTGALVNSGVVDIGIENNHYFSSVVNGKFSLAVTRCNSSSTTATIIAYDDLSLVQSTASVVTVADTAVNIGQLTACAATVSEYLNYKLDGKSTLFTSPADSIMVNSRSGAQSIWFSRKTNTNANDEVYMLFNAKATGNTPVINLEIQNNNTTYVLRTATNINITEYGPVGGYIAGSFNMTLKDSLTAATYPLTGNLRVKRTF